MKPDLIEKHRRGFVIFGDSSQMNHRALIIQSACDIERSLVAVLLKYFVASRPDASPDKIAADMLDEKGVLDSLGKMAKAAYYLGVIDSEVAHDVQKLTKLRNRYAHDLQRHQLDNDPEMYKLITDTFLYKRNARLLKDLRPQSVFLCIRDQLIQTIGGAEDGSP